MEEHATAEAKLPSNVGRKVLISLLVAVVFGGLLINVLKVTRTYLICGDPVPSISTLNGQKQDLSPNGCFIYNGWYGEDLLSMTFQNGTDRKVRLYPRVTDDNSTVFKVTPTSETMFGDLKYKVE